MRREIELFVPFAAIVLVGLTLTTLFIHRSALHDLRDDRRTTALRAVDRVVADLAAGAGTEATLLRHRLGPEVGILLLEPDGRIHASIGPPPPGDPLAPLDAGQRAALDTVAVFGPDRRTSGAVVVFAPIVLDGRPLVLRRDEPARKLAALGGALPLLTTTVVGACTALLVLLGLYVRHLLRPFDLLLDRARQVEGASVDAGDDVASILRTFDRALDALRARSAEERERSAEDSARTTEEGELAVLERALTHLESGLLLLDAEGRLLALNDSGSELLAVNGPIEGRDFEEVLAHQPELCTRLREALLAKSPVQRAEIAVHGDAAERVVGLTLNPLRRDDDRIRGWLGLFADLTEARRAARTRQLGESLHHVGELTAGLAHELRNGLASLRGYLTLIERGAALGRTEPDPEARGATGLGMDTLTDYLGEIRREVDDLHRVAEDFLDFARPGHLQPVRLQPERLAHRAAADPALNGAAVRVEIAPRARELEAHGDPHLIGRALRNLLDNAVRAQREATVAEPVRLIVEVGGREVAGHASENPVELRFRIVDSGPGLAPSVRDRLFVPFATARAGGSGLGLSLAQRIAQLHGGKVEIHEPAGGGVEAVLTLPAGAIDTVGNGPRRRPAGGSNGKDP
jgi:signal transduction histidine kinase